jgi:hypothetical protein
MTRSCWSPHSIFILLFFSVGAAMDDQDGTADPVSASKSQRHLDDKIRAKESSPKPQRLRLGGNDNTAMKDLRDRDKVRKVPSVFLLLVEFGF